MAMFHNAFYDMSSRPTPIHNGRGAPVPGIDTSVPFRKPDPSAAVSYSGWLTPPQSARDSRRPSLAFSSLSDAPYSASGTDFSFSQPATPSNSFDHSHDQYGRQFQHLSMSARNTPSHASSGPFIAGSLQEHLVQSGMHAHSQCTPKTVDQMHPYTFPDHSGVDCMHIEGTNYMSSDCWSGPQMASQTLQQQQSNGMTATLFDTSQALALDAVSLYNPVDTLSQPPTAYSHATASMYDDPQVIVPSQLEPQDDYMPDYSYESPEQGSGHIPSDFSTSFDSTDSYTFVRGPTPEDAYLASEDEDGYTAIKGEALWSPTPAKLQRQRRRTTNGWKRSRKAPEMCQEKRVGHIRVQAMGNFSMDQHGVIAHPGIVKSKSKKYPCPGIEANTGLPCNRAFQRSEHLKRHMKSHNKVELEEQHTWPDFPCPINGCPKTGPKGISRSDNATDHFITHLEPTKPGKRNNHCEWPTMEDAIRSEYPEPQATKILDNIQKRVSKRKAEHRWPGPKTEAGVETASTCTEFGSVDIKCRL